MGFFEDLVLEGVDLVVEPVQDREETVDQRIDHPVQQEYAARGAVLAHHGGMRAHLVEHQQRVAMDRDQIALRVERVHLDSAGRVVLRPVHDEVDVLVVRLELRPLPELLQILESQWVHLEVVRQQGDRIGVELGNVEPEGLGVLHRVADAGHVCRLAQAVRQQDLPLH